MRFGGRRDLVAVAGAVAAVLLLVSIRPVYAQVPILQGDLGGEGKVAVFQPFAAGYTELSAISSNSDVVQVGGIEKPQGGGVSYSLQGQGVGIVTVAWRNPTLNRVVQGFFVVASGVIVDSAETMTLTIGPGGGQVMQLAIPRVLRANAYVGTTALPSTAVVASGVQQSVGVQLTARSVGTSFVNIELPRDANGIPHYQVMIVHVVASGQPPTY